MTAFAHIPALDIDIRLDFSEQDCDELTPAVPSARMREIASQPDIDIPHLGDLPKTSILVMMPFVRGNGAFPLWCTISEHRGQIAHIAFPSAWREEMRKHGYPDDENAERLIESLAWAQWIKRQA